VAVGRRPAGPLKTTYHLVPADVWATQAPDAPYAAASLGSEGFTHCTDGVEAMVATANRFYGTDRRSFVVLTIDLDALSVPWRYDDPGLPFPHIYGQIDSRAIVATTSIPRDDDGRFLPFPG
jgi:uncharacterized protein (DUF952 family)